MNNGILQGVLARVFHMLPIKGGLTRICFNPLIEFLIGSEPTASLARLRDGNLIEVSMADYHGRILYFFGTNDPKVQETTSCLLQPGEVFLDIGANYSSIGLAAASVVGPKGFVHLFEPQKLLGNRVQDAIEAGKYSNVRLHRIGLMDKDDTLVLHSPSYHSGMATFADHDGASAFNVAETCEVKNIATYVAPLVNGRPFGAKLDIEGAEPKVMPWLVDQPNLSFLVFESAHNKSLLFETIRASGLVLYGLKRTLLRVRLSRIDGFSEVARFHDLLAVRIDERIAPKSTSPRALGALLAAR